MKESLRLIYQRIIENVPTKHYRYLYKNFSTSDRLTGLIGARGVGKTTLILQFIKNNFPNLSDAFYVSADHIYFQQSTLYEFIENLYLTENIENFFIDEIHKYKNWNQEIKNLYDGFPTIKIVFSGSSSLDLVKGSYDLSRRSKLFHLAGMSLREYINIKTNVDIEPITFDELIHSHQQLSNTFSQIVKIKGIFKDYLQKGYYPFSSENPVSYYEKILQTINKSIYEDIANFYNLKTENLHLFNKILNYIANTPPGNLSVHNIAKNLKIDDKTALNYIGILHETKLATLIFADATGNQILRKPGKIFLENTNLQHALSSEINVKPNIGRLRELYFIQAIRNANLTPLYANKGDFYVNDVLFEVGGANKTRRQISTSPNAIIVKDDILTSAKGIIPLYFFGFLY